MHSKIFIPLDNERCLMTKVQYGDFYSIGLRLLQSGSHLPQLIQLIKVFGGMPIYYTHTEDKYKLYDELYEHNYIDKINTFPNSQIKEKFLEAHKLLQENQIDLVINSDYAKIDIQEKLNTFYSYSTIINNNEIMGFENIITNTQKAQKICREYSVGYEQDNNTRFLFQSLDFNCLFNGNECFVKLYDPNETQSYYVPLLLAYLNHTDLMLFDEDEMRQYFMNSLSGETLVRATEIYQLNQKNGKLMNDEKWQQITPYLEATLEKEKIEKLIPNNELVLEKKKIKI
jgi:hypothetical protein